MLTAAHKICPSCKARASADTRFCPGCGNDLVDVALSEGDPYVGLTLADKYVIQELIGEGAMGQVYKAKQIPLGKPFAAKILAPHLMHDEASHARFANEAHNAASLNHPNCVSVVDYGRTPEGITYIVMEYIAGRTLEHIIAEEHPLARERIADLILQVLAALTEAHGLGILHRDLKPENILVQELRTHGELAKVLDFGIAKLMDATAGGPGLTSQGMVCGTPEYMSPEQARGQKLDARSDLYAVGVILYQMLTGRPPFESTSAVEILHKHLHEDPVAPSVLMGREADPLEAVCLRAMAKEPDARYGSAHEFREEVIAATSPTAAMKTCAQCGAQMRAEHRFCPSCGAEAPERTAGSAGRRRPSSRGSGLNIPRGLGEPTAEVVVRNFPLPLVGRDLPFQRAKTLLARPQVGVKVRALTGPRGIGKTRMGDEIASLAEQQGWRVFYVGADPSGARAPLWPIQCMVAQLLELDPLKATTHDLGRVANLTGLAFEGLPGLAELFELEGPAHDLEFAVRRRECFASAVHAMLGGGRGQPLLLIFDDLDAYDTPSREVVRRLAHSSSASPVVLLCTTNETELGWLGGIVEPLELLGPDVVEQIGRQVTMEVNPKSKLPEALARVAPLTPLKLESHLRLLAAGIQAPGDASEEELVKARIEQLDDTSRSLLALGSVLGERFLEVDLAAMFEQESTGATAGELDQALSALHVGGILLVIGNGERAFAHRVLHDVVYASIPQARRRSLHALAAKISRVARKSVTVRVVHQVRARSPGVIDGVTEAAQRAERLFDDPAVADFATAGLRVLGDGKTRDERHRRTELALVASRSMRLGDAVLQAIDMLEAERDKDHEPADEALLLAELGLQLSRRERFDDAIVALKKALGPAIAAGDRSAMHRVYYNLGKVYARKGDLERAVSELREGLDMFTLGEGPRAAIDLDLWRYLLKICRFSREAGELQEARTWCEHALHQAERRGDHLGLLRCHTQLAWVLRDLKQMALAEQHLARALDEARYFGDRLTTAELLIERARARAARGRLTEALRCCEEALRLATGIQWDRGVEHAKRAIAMLSRQAPTSSQTTPSERSGTFQAPDAANR